MALIVFLVFRIVHTNGQEIGIKSQYNFTQKTELKTNNSTHLFGYWCTPSSDYIPQWIYYKFKKHQVDISYNSFDKFLTQLPEEISNEITIGERFRIKEYNIKYNYFFSCKSIQPFTFFSANLQQQKNKFIDNSYNSFTKEYSANYTAINGAIIRGELGLGIQIQKNNFGFYFQAAVPIVAAGKIKTNYYNKGEFVLDQNNNTQYVDYETYSESTVNKTVLLQPKDLKIKRGLVQVGFQYQLLGQKQSPSKDLEASKNEIAINVGFVIMGINYATSGYTLNISINNNYQIAYFNSDFDKYSINLYPDFVKQECLIVSKVYMKNNFRFSGGLGGQIIQGKFNSFLPLLYTDAGYMINKNMRAGLIFSRSFFSNNAQPEENINPLLPISFYFQFPIFSTNWLTEKKE